MTDEVELAANELAAALQAENDALRALDVRRAVTHLPDKLAGARRLERALADTAAPAPRAARDGHAWATRLQTLAEDNKRLLERAMTVQGQVMAILIQAIPRPGTGYGRVVSTAPVAPITLSARA